MSGILENVSFPIQGRGETARVGDRWPLRLLSLSGCTIGPSWGGGGRDDMASPFWRVYLNFDEGAVAHFGRKSIPLAPGATVVIPAWCSWRAECRKPVRHGNALLDLPSIGRERARLLFPEPVTVAPPGDPLSIEGIEVLGRLAEVPVAGEALEARGTAWIWAVLSRLLEMGRGNTALSQQGDFPFQMVLHHLEQRLGSKLSRRQVAAMARVSEAEIARRFRDYLGTSPARWIRERRMTLAAQLLRQTEEPIETVAERTGLGDRAQFSKAFAKTFGVGPATWRRNQKGAAVDHGSAKADAVVTGPR